MERDGFMKVFGIRRKLVERSYIVVIPDFEEKER